MAHRLSRVRRSIAGSLSLFALLTAVVASSAVAAPVISDLHFTGSTYPAGTGGADPYWQVVAWPNSWTGKPSSPYQAFVFSGNPGGGQNVPNPWAPGSSDPAKGTNPVQYGGRWIGLQDNNATSVLTPTSTPSTYSTIYATTFTASEAGTADLSFLATADNNVTLFVNGSIVGAGTDTPTISGGETVGSAFGLGSLKWVENSVAVNAGTNVLYAVVNDVNSTGTYGSTGLIVVPEPSTYASACLGLATFGLLRMRRRAAGHRG